MRPSNRFPIPLLALPALLACAAPAVVFISPQYNPQQVGTTAFVGLGDYPQAAGSGEAVSDILQTYLLSLGYNFVERQQVQSIMKEQSFDLSGAVDVGTMQQMGKLLGAGSLVLGNVTNFAETSEQTVMVDMPEENSTPIFGNPQGGPLGRGGRGGPGIVGYDVTETDQVIPETETLPAQVGISVRLVAVKTGEILWSGSDSSEGENTTEAAQNASANIITALQKALAQQAAPPPQS